MKSSFKKIFSCFLIACLLVASFPVYFVKASSSTGVGLCEHVFRAYYENWQYCYGGTSEGLVDCSGLIWTYNAVGGNRTSFMSCSPETGYVSNGIPNIHGLGLYQPGHVGVYVGGGMAIDARDEYSDICYQSVYTKNWTNWFKIYGVTYPTNGWVSLQGNSYYYENGEYIVNTSRTINGTTYNFDGSGKSDKNPDSSDFVTDLSQAVESTDTYTQNEENSSQTVSNTQSKPAVSKPSTSGSSKKTTSTKKTTTKKKQEEEKKEISFYSGMMGDEIQNLQTRLKELKYFNDDITNFFGTVTEESVKAFQADANLEVTGIVDQKTYDKIYSNDAPTAKFDEFSVGDYSDDIVEIQQKLIDLGYFYDEATGYFGDVTEIAVSQFQATNEIKTSGVVDEITYEKLFDDNAQKNPNAGTLTLGMKGDSVKAMQERLFDLRYYKAESTGEYDDETRAAVESFLINNNLSITVEMTSENLQILYSNSAKKSPDFDSLQLNYVGNDVKDLQIRLKSVNCFDGVADGIFGTETQTAVKKAQSSLGLEQTGVATKEFIDKLNVLLMKVNALSANKASLKTAKLANEALAGAVDSIGIEKNDINLPYIITLSITAILILLVGAGIFIFWGDKATR